MAEADCPQLISVKEAEQAISATSTRLDTSMLALEQALGRVIAEPALAKVNLPPFEQAAMDGFAVQHADFKTHGDTPVVLQLAGEVAAGQVYNRPLGPGQAVWIMTGAPLPPCADSVVMQEHASWTETNVSFNEKPELGQHVRHAGEDVAVSAPLLEPGDVIEARQIAALAAAGCHEVVAFRPIRVAAIVTGSELTDAGDSLGPGYIYDSNSWMLRSLLRSESIDTIAVQRCQDDLKQLTECINRLLTEVDILLLTGGVSVGRHDYGRAALRELGVRDVFWKVAQKPGKPLYYGLHGDTQVFGLPGNPVSTWLCFLRYVRPAIALRLGHQSPWPRHLVAKTTASIRKRAQFTFFCRGTVQGGAGQLRFTPTAAQGSHQLVHLLDANALAELPPGRACVDGGDQVDVLQLSNGWLGESAWR